MVFVKTRAVAAIAFAFFSFQSMSAEAQTAPAPAQTASVTPPKSADDATIVTIFGKKHVPLRTTIDATSASSCAFMNDPYGQSFGRTTEAYLQPDDDGGTDGNNGSVRTFSPNGDASRGTSPMYGAFRGPPRSSGPAGRNFSNACGMSDAFFAAGRAYIKAHDTSLRDAYAAFDAKDYPRALDLFAKSYNKMGYEDAAIMEAKMYLFGVGTEQNTDKAVVWLRKVAGSPAGSSHVMTFKPSDPTHASVWVDAAMMLAHIYMVGFGTPIDAHEARIWFGKADDYGFMPATHIIGKSYLYGYGGGEKNQAKALKHFRKAADVGYAPSQYEVGFAYYTGAYGLTEDRKTGAKWLIAAAQSGDEDALYSVGRLYDLGETVPQDAQKALVYYKEAALKGQPEAQEAVGTYFYNGEIVGKDLVMARKWFTEAAKGGDEDAMFNLGAMYALGEGGSKDMAVAYVWFKLAEASGLEKATAAANEIAAKLTPEERARAESALHPTA